MSSSGWRDRLQAAPLWGLFLYFGAAFGVVSYFFHPAVETRSVAASAVGGLFFGVAMTGVMAFRRRREDQLAGPGVRAQLTQALRTGEPPTDPTRDIALLALVQKRRQELDRAAMKMPWMYGGFLVLSLLLAIDQPAWLAFAAFFLGLLVVSPRTNRSSQEKLNRLDSLLRTRNAVEPERDS